VGLVSQRNHEPGLASIRGREVEPLSFGRVRKPFGRFEEAEEAKNP
jgi:hypothetical protein